MKTKALTLLVILMLFQAHGSVYSQPLALNFSLNDLIQHSVTPQDLSAILKTHFKFVEDEEQFGQEDYWQAPEQFLKTKAGDCEDFALLAQQILSQHGTPAYVINIYGYANYAHTVTLFQDEKGFYNVVNQDKLKEYRAETVEEAITKVYSGWTWAAVAELRYSRGWMIRKINRP